MDNNTKNAALKSIVDTLVQACESIKKTAYDEYMKDVPLGVPGPAFGALFSEADRAAYEDARHTAQAASDAFFEAELAQVEDPDRKKEVEGLKMCFDNMLSDSRHFEYGYSVYFKKFIDAAYPAGV